jgi:hypothetical protein
MRGELSVKRNLTAVWISREERENVLLRRNRRQISSIEHLKMSLMNEFRVNLSLEMSELV